MAADFFLGESLVGDGNEVAHIDLIIGSKSGPAGNAFANALTITGRDVMLKQMTTLLGKVKSLAHPLINVWQEDGGVVILEVTSIWRLHDDTVVEIKACSIFTLADGKFVDQRIYVDNAPVDPFLG